MELQLPSLMIHRIQESFFDLPLRNYTLTFDDGYLCHYQYRNRFDTFTNQKLYFIVPDWIGQEGFMSLQQIKELAQEPNSIIGCHSFGHFHRYPIIDNGDVEMLRVQLTQDTELMCNWFQTNLGKIPQIFCYPYNNDFNGIYKEILLKHGFTEFYGSERLPIESLLS